MARASFARWSQCFGSPNEVRMPCATGCTGGRSGRADGLPKNQISVTCGHTAVWGPLAARTSLIAYKGAERSRP